MEKSTSIDATKLSIIREKTLSITGVILTIGSMVFGVMTLTMGYQLEYVSAYSKLLLVPFLTGVIFVMAGELFVGRKSSTLGVKDKKIERDFDRLSSEINALKEGLVDNYQKNEENITNNSVTSVNLTKEEKEVLFNKLSENVHQLITKSIIAEVGDQQKNKIQHEDVLNFSAEFRERLIRESERLSSRANTNLFIGSITSIIGIAFLGFVLIGGSTYNVKLSTEGLSIQLAEYALYYLPRLTLIIFIEIFSYFFLRLYKATLEDIKYYQNELTNIDSNISALRLSLLLNDSESIKKVATKLLETERNFVLKKGDTTVQLEVARTEAEKSSEALKMFENLFKETKSFILPRKN